MPHGGDGATSEEVRNRLSGREQRRRSEQRENLPLNAPEEVVEAVLGPGQSEDVEGRAASQLEEQGAIPDQRDERVDLRTDKQGRLRAGVAPEEVKRQVREKQFGNLRERVGRQIRRAKADSVGSPEYVMDDSPLRYARWIDEDDVRVVEGEDGYRLELTPEASRRVQREMIDWRYGGSYGLEPDEEDYVVEGSDVRLTEEAQKESLLKNLGSYFGEEDVTVGEQGPRLAGLEDVGERYGGETYIKKRSGPGGVPIVTRSPRDEADMVVTGDTDMQAKVIDDDFWFQQAQRAAREFTQRELAAANLRDDIEGGVDPLDVVVNSPASLTREAEQRIQRMRAARALDEQTETDVDVTDVAVGDGSEFRLDESAREREIEERAPDTGASVGTGMRDPGDVARETAERLNERSEQAERLEGENLAEEYGVGNVSGVEEQLESQQFQQQVESGDVAVTQTAGPEGRRSSAELGESFVEEEARLSALEQAESQFDRVEVGREDIVVEELESGGYQARVRDEVVREEARRDLAVQLEEETGREVSPEQIEVTETESGEFRARVDRSERVGDSEQFGDIDWSKVFDVGNDEMGADDEDEIERQFDEATTEFARQWRAGEGPIAGPVQDLEESAQDLIRGRDPRETGAEVGETITDPERLLDEGGGQGETVAGPVGNVASETYSFVANAPAEAAYGVRGAPEFVELFGTSEGLGRLAEPVGPGVTAASSATVSTLLESVPGSIPTVEEAAQKAETKAQAEAARAKATPTVQVASAIAGRAVESAREEPVRTATRGVLAAGAGFAATKAAGTAARSLPVRPSAGRFRVGGARGVTAGVRRQTGRVVTDKPLITVGRGLEGRTPIEFGTPRVARTAVPDEGVGTSGLGPSETRAMMQFLEEGSDAGDEASMLREARGTIRETQRAGLEPDDLETEVANVLETHGVDPDAAPRVLREIADEEGGIYGSTVQRASATDLDRPGLGRESRDIDVRVEDPEGFAERITRRLNERSEGEPVELEGGKPVSRETGEKLFDIHGLDEDSASSGVSGARSGYTFAGIRTADEVDVQGVTSTSLSEQTARKARGGLNRILADPDDVGGIEGQLVPEHQGRVKDIPDFYVGERAQIEALRRQGRLESADVAEENLESFIERFPDDVQEQARRQAREGLDPDSDVVEPSVRLDRPGALERYRVDVDSPSPSAAGSSASAGAGSQASSIGATGASASASASAAESEASSLFAEASSLAESSLVESRGSAASGVASRGSGAGSSAAASVPSVSPVSVSGSSSASSSMGSGSGLGVGASVLSLPTVAASGEGSAVSAPPETPDQDTQEDTLPTPESDVDTDERPLAPGWLAETFTTIATQGRAIPSSPGQEVLEEQPEYDMLTGELPTAELLEGGEDIEAVLDLFGGGER